MDVDYLSIKVIPKASQNEVVGFFEEEGEKILKIKVTAAPEKGKANKAVLKLLSQHFTMPISRFTIIQGVSGPRKMVKIKSLQRRV